MIERLREKYRSRDLIEIDWMTYNAAVHWVVVREGFQIHNMKEGLRRLVAAKGQFIKFLNSGVILYTTEDGFIVCIPFEFTSDLTVRFTFNVRDPDFKEGDDPQNQVKILCKVEVDSSLEASVVSGTMDEELFWRYRQWLKVTGRAEGQIMWIKTVVNENLLLVILVNAYLALLEKDILITRVEQTRTPQPGNGRRGRQNRRNPFFRYVVTLPADYQPRPLNVNFFVSEWSRSGHSASRWVRAENAEALARRRGGRVTGRRRWELVSIEIPIRPQTCRRRAGEVAEHQERKIYGQ